MTTFSSLFFDRRSQVRRAVVAVGLSVALVASALVPSLASAAQITTRSISLSDSITGATDVSYTVNFTATQAAASGAFIVDFCNDSPDPTDTTCVAPTGFDSSGVAADATSTGYTASQLGSSTSTVEVDGPIIAGANSVILDHINNPTVPSSTAPLYARILTYDSTAHAAAYDVSSTSKTGLLDTGGVSIQIQDKIQVSAAVLESMTFCVASVAPTSGCGDATANPPVLKLGSAVGSSFALQPGVPSSGNLYAQLSTNALSGATVSLRSSTTGCGGLERQGDGACGIGPALTAGVDGTAALFGVETGALAAASDAAGSDNGTIQAYGTSGSTNYYNGSTYKLNYVSGDGSGVTGPYGDPFLDTAGAPVNNKNITISFAAAVTNSTAAGNYSADLNMIATGKF